MDNDAESLRRENIQLRAAIEKAASAAGIDWLQEQLELGRVLTDLGYNAAKRANNYEFGKYNENEVYLQTTPQQMEVNRGFIFLTARELVELLWTAVDSGVPEDTHLIILGLLTKREGS